MGAMQAFTFLVAIAIFTSASLATNPGFQTAVTSNGLEYFAKIGLPLLKKQLSNIEIPDFSGSGFSVRSIRVTACDLPNLSLVPTTSGIKTSASGISLSVSAKWSYKKAFLKASGSVDMSASAISMAITALVKNDKGHFSLASNGCAFNIGNLNVKFHGGWALLLNLFRKNIANTIKSKLNRMACDKITKLVDTQGNKMLQSLPIVTPLGRIAEIDYSLIDDPTFTNTYVSSRHKGEFRLQGKASEAPFPPHSLPGVTSTEKMMYLWASDYIANTAGYVYQRAGALNKTLTPENTKIPPGVPFCLNTKCIKDLIPEFYSKFPDQDIVLRVGLTKPPTMSIQPAGISGLLPGNIEVYARANNTLSYAFTLGVMTDINVTVDIEEKGMQNCLVGHANFISAKLSLADSAIGKLNIEVLQQAVDFLSSFGVGYLNHMASKGIPLPTVEGITLQNVKTQLGMGYLYIETDFAYQPAYLYTLYTLD